MGTQMVGKGIESAALTGAAGPVGIVGAALTGAALTSAYIAGEAPEWVRYQEGTKEANWRERARVAELQARNEPGIVRGSARIAGAIEGWFANALGLSPTTGYTDDPRTLELLKKEKEASGSQFRCRIEDDQAEMAAVCQVTDQIERLGRTGRRGDRQPREVDVTGGSVGGCR